ncbi:MAG TPA: HPP family protein [Bacillota bacterium]|nr:HPP family protein [Bacillota bacterium]
MGRNILDEKFLENKGRYLVQCAMAFLTILIILLVLNVFEQTALIASLGASAFIVFAMPGSYSAKPRSIIGGYFFGITTGVLFNVVARLPYIRSLPISAVLEYTFFSAVAVGLTMLAMVVFNVEHPPAAGMALGLVLQNWQVPSLALVIVAVLMLSAVRVVLRDYLIDLH